MKNHKVVRLLQEGFRFETLKMLNESQINTLYGKVILEQGTSITDATKKAKEELGRFLHEELEKNTYDYSKLMS